MESKEEEKKEGPIAEVLKEEEETSDLAKTLRLQSEQLDARILALDKRELAFNAREREAKISGKTFAVEKIPEKKDTPEEYADKVMRGEANPLKDDKIIP